MIGEPATLVIAAGANGAGKTTLVRRLSPGSVVLNPDELAKEVGSDIGGARRLLESAHILMAAGRSFAIETTLSGNWHIAVLRRARLAGYRIALHYVGVEDFDILLKRVANRVAKGGHDVPIADQTRRYPRSLANVPRTAPLCDAVLLYDNSGEAGHVLVCDIVMRPFACRMLAEPVPEWAAAMARSVADAA